MPLAAPAHAAPALERFPTIDQDRIAFVARDALWTAPRDGGAASRLFFGPARPMLPRFSPDGSWIAFTAIHGTTADVDLVAARGGAVRRLTFTSTEGLSRGAPDNMVVGWTPDSRSVVFLSRRWSWNGWTERPASVPIEGGLPSPLPLDRAGFLSFSPDGRQLVATRVMRDFAPWGRYDGGQREDLGLLDLRSGHWTKLPPGRGTDTSPMWLGRTIYFLSDRAPNRRLNIWAFDPTMKTAHQVTRFSDFDVRFPSAGANAIVFEQGGNLWRMDLPSETIRPVDVRLPDDETVPRPHIARIASAVRILEGSQYPGNEQHPDFALSPDGDRAVFSARGDIVVAPTAGHLRDLVDNSAADADHPAFSPDGRLIAYTTDRTGEQELAIKPADGGNERILTHFASGYLYTPTWSPDGRLLAIPDANHALWIVRADESRAPVVLARDKEQEIRDLAFSPDSRWLAYCMHDAIGRSSIHLYELARHRDHTVSEQLESDSMPVFSSDGRMLLFVSDRQGVEAVSTSERDVATLRASGVYVAMLQADAESPVGRPAPALMSTHPTGPLRIDLDGLADRVVPLNVAPSTIGALAMRGDRVFYETTPTMTMEGPVPGEASALHVQDIATGRDTTLATGLVAFELSGDGSKVLVRSRRGWEIDDTDGENLQSHDGLPDRRPAHMVLDLGAMQAVVDPRQEWREMFNNAWRLERDLYVDRDMGGVDWQKAHDRYAKLLPQLGSRDDLTAVLGALLGELGSSHLRVAGGDEPKTAAVTEASLLGAGFTADPALGRYRLTDLLAGDESRPAERSPLREPGLDVRDGDVVLAINGHDIRMPANPFALLQARAGRVAITIAPAPTGVPRTVVVDPLDDEEELRQAAWIGQRRAIVDRLSGGRLAYVYVPDMGEEGAEQFARQFFPQTDRQGLVIDERFNRGGYLSPFLTERLLRHTYGSFVNREGGAETLPQRALTGPKALLINQFCASDAENFAYLFHAAGLGLRIGMRTMGGVRGVAGSWRLRDGGVVSVPFSQLENARGRRLIEGHGVDPDIEVEDLPDATLSGHDAQLETAVRLLLAKLSDPAVGTAIQRAPL